MPTESFFSLFIQLNQLDNVTHFLFQPGMLFNDTLKWWGSRNRRPLSNHPWSERHLDVPVLRPRPHEGIDICLMQRFDLRPDSVLPQMLIPALLPGQLVHFHRDFLGETLYFRHADIREQGAVLHTLYGHVSSAPKTSATLASMPCGHPHSSGSVCGQPLSAGYNCPSFIDRGQRVGTISSPPATCSVPAHLHISCAWIREEQQVEELNWENMAVNCNVLFVDPLPFLVQ
ncbi:MAG: hypothetical protein K0A99_11080 [Desulfoarculaceae bacterium]|nr:hypothetical protein [Desulfoarculaceae bacterium]